MAKAPRRATPKRTDALSPGVFADINDLAFDGGIYGAPMWFSPKEWAKVAASPKRKWTGIDFPPSPLTLIPPKPGVYVFFVMPEIFGLPQASGLMYVGKAKSLRARISSYLGEIDTKFALSDRPYVWRMLNVWHGHLHYLYTETADVKEAEALEDDMLVALRPPANKQYPGTMRKRQKAFQ